MNPEKRHLIESLLDEGEVFRREEVLRGGGRILRRRRRQRLAWRALAGMVVVALVIFSAQKWTVPQPRVLATVVLPQQHSGSLTDAQLLGLFPNTPVGLITLENRTKRLIFPRPGDDQRYMARY